MVSKKNLKEAYKVGKYDGLIFVEDMPEEHNIEIKILVDGELMEPGHYLGDIMESFTQYSEWSGFYLPLFRQLAGYKDTMNVGTFTDGTEDNHWDFEQIIERYEAGQMNGFLTALIKKLSKEHKEWMKVK